MEFVTLLAELLINTVPKRKLILDKHYAYQSERWGIASHVVLSWPQSEKDASGMTDARIVCHGTSEAD